MAGFLWVALLGCRGGGEEQLDGISSQDVIGWVHKGPFEAGGTVRVESWATTLDQPLLLGETVITDDLGAYALSVAGSGPVQLSATGTWYNEISGTSTGESLTLRAHAEIAR